MEKKLPVAAFFLIQLMLHGQSAFSQAGRNNLQVTQGNSSSQFTVNYKSDNHGPITIMVFDITGKYVYIKNYGNFEGDLKETIDLNASPKGIYVLEVESDSSRETKKIVYQ
jgi:hypothetical protein